MVLSNLFQAIRNYPENNLELSIENVNGPGDVVNVGEYWSFYIQATNKGQLDMVNLRLHVEAGKGISVGPAPLSTVLKSSYITPSTRLDAHSSRRVAVVFFRAGASAKGDKSEIASVHVSSWDASLHHLLYDHSVHSDIPTEILSRKVIE